LHSRIDTLIELAVEEDAPMGDLTSEAIFTTDHKSHANIIARQDMVVCGLQIAEKVFLRIDPNLKIEKLAKDGDRVEKGSTVMAVEGSTISLLTTERIALNFLKRLSGIATLSRIYSDAARTANLHARVVDTRKTTPGWRSIEKYAVRCGGCLNHRSSLSEHVMIKENHITAAGSLTKAVQLARAHAPHVAKIEVEAEDLDDVREALDAGAEIILLDNMALDIIEQAVKIIDKRAMVEVSGGITLDTIADYAATGADVISVGALTHSAPAADFSMIIPRG
jgi:nicotinate-nucleotide pyrophosphorylase (carboxylating)